MSTPLGKESLSFFCKSGALFFGVGYGVVKTGWLQRKERKLEAKQEALGSSLPRTLPDTQTHTHTHVLQVVLLGSATEGNPATA